MVLKSAHGPVGSPQQYGDARPDVADGAGDRGAVEARLGLRGVSIFHS